MNVNSLLIMILFLTNPRIAIVGFSFLRKDSFCTKKCVHDSAFIKNRNGKFINGEGGRVLFIQAEISRLHFFINKRFDPKVSWQEANIFSFSIS